MGKVPCALMGPDTGTCCETFDCVVMACWRATTN